MLLLLQIMKLSKLSEESPIVQEDTQDGGIRSGIQHLEIVHHSGKKTLNVDCFSRQPDLPAPQDNDGDVQIAVISIISR